MDDADTPAAEVARVVAWLTGHGVTYQVNGGWAVDALRGEQTRRHRDLDVFVDADRVQALLDWLAGRGYVVTEDWHPVRVELTSSEGIVDVHPMAIGPAGDGVQEGLGGETFVHAAADRTLGRIGDAPVVVATAARLRQLRQGYAPRPVDVHDLGVLDELDRGRQGR